MTSFCNSTGRSLTIALSHVSQEVFLRNCTLTNNTADGGDGGGMYVHPDEYVGQAQLLLDDCTILSNMYVPGWGVHSHEKLN